MIAMGQRNASIGRSPNGRRDPWNDIHIDAAGRQIVPFLASAAEHERVAAFQPDHPLSGKRQFGQQSVYLVLRSVMDGPGLAHEHTLGVAADVFKDLRTDQAVVDHNVRFLDRAHGAEGQKVRVARTGADD